MKKNNIELFKIATLFIFLEKYPMHEIPIIDIQTKGVIEWNPRKTSVSIIQKIGREKANFLSENLFTANKAIPAIGVKFGG